MNRSNARCSSSLSPNNAKVRTPSRKPSVYLSCLFSLLAGTSALPAGASVADHQEFQASLQVPFRASADTTLKSADEARYFTMNFDFPLVAQEQAVAWKLELLDSNGKLIENWYGIESLFKQRVSKKILWAGRTNANKTGNLKDGLYQVRLSAIANDATLVARRTGTIPQIVENLFKNGGSEVALQNWPMQVGNISKPAMPQFNALPTRTEFAKQAKQAKPTALATAVPAPGNLPYTVYLGNLHSQTNHSDGGGDVTTCTGSQKPQTGVLGPADAYLYGMNHGLDILVTSEHNHLYDGSDSTNAAADPAVAKSRYQSGLAAASKFNAANPNFLAIYGLEWGVISNGGHLNIFNTNELLAWESNSSGQLIGDTFTAKSDYGALYTLMRQRGWIGQFNHPSPTAQFKIGTTDFAYSADGDQAMVLCEALDSDAFSSNTTETTAIRSSYEAGCNKILEAGYHVAFSTNQDNHCANWGSAYTNRTGVLIPNGAALNNASFLAALKARRVYATMDKNSQLIFTANGHLMGERFANTGPLNLVSNFSSSTGRSVTDIAIFEGVPGRNGTVTQLSNTANTSITPTNGEHFYYAKITQDDGNFLWSAPVWVTQSGSTGQPDTTAPVISVSEAGTQGSITFSATATDNLGVGRVEFYIDNVLRGTVTNAPYNLALDSTTLTNASHVLNAKAYDAANNVGTSNSVNFSIANPVADTTAPTVSASATGSSGTITLAANASDNVGVTLVEFYVDGILKGSTSTAPYTLALNSTTLTNASHALTAKAYDAAKNVGSASAVNFTVNNSVAKELILNGGFESGGTSWVASKTAIFGSGSTHTGSFKAKLNGLGSTNTDTLYQQVTIPATATSATLSFWLEVVSSETTTTQAYDTLKVQITNSSGTVLATLASYSNLNKGSTYLNKTFNLASYKGQTIRISFVGVEGSVTATGFLIDDVSLIAQ